MSEEKKEEKKQAAKPTPPPTPTPQLSNSDKKSGRVIYLGPPMMEPGFQISYGTIYSNGLPNEIEARIKTDAVFAKLFVPVEDAPKAMRELTRQGSDLLAAKRQASAEYIERKRNNSRGNNNG